MEMNTEDGKTIKKTDTDLVDLTETQRGDATAEGTGTRMKGATEIETMRGTGIAKTDEEVIETGVHQHPHDHHPGVEPGVKKNR